MPDDAPSTSDDALPVAGTPAPPGRTPAAVLLLAIGVVGLLAGGVFAAVSVSAERNTPQEAVRQFFEAIEDRDLLGVLESLAPGERDALRGPVVRLTGELKRLGVLAPNADLSRISGVELSVQDLRLTEERLTDDLTAVIVRGGRSRSRVDPAQLPLGDFARSLAGESLEQAPPVTEDDSVADDEPDESPIVTVREDGRWYVTLGYSAAESARRSSGRPLPDFDKGLRAAGADSAEGAVRAALEAASRLDVERMIRLLAPGEFGALQDYAPLFLEDLRRGTEDARSQFRAQIKDLQLASRRLGDGTLVTIRRIAFEAASTDGGFSVDFDGSCATVTTGEENRRVCQSDIDQLRDELFRVPGSPPLADLTRRRPDIGFVTVEEDGKWYLSPTRTLLDDLTNLAKVLERKDLEDLRSFFEQIGDGDEVPVPPPDADPGADDPTVPPPDVDPGADEPIVPPPDADPGAGEPIVPD